MYNDFLGEIIAEETRGGRKRKPNANNPVTRRRKAMQAKLDEQARELGKPKHEIALEQVTANIGDLQRYVTVQGEQPLKNPVELATQAFVLREKDIANVMRTIGVSRQDAELYLEEAESKATQVNSADADNFIGSIIGAITSVAQQGAAKIAAKREAQGKKPGFWGMVAGAGQQQQTQQQDTQKDDRNFADAVKVAAKDVIDKIKEEEKRKEINKMLPYIIGGVVVLILLTVLITKNAGKR